MRKVELWGLYPGGANAKVVGDLAERIDRLIAEYGADVVAQVAVLQSGVMPVDIRSSEIHQR